MRSPFVLVASRAVGVGAAFGDTRGFGLLIALAIAVQNWMVGRGLLPDAFAQGSRPTVVVGAMLGFASMLALQLSLSS